MSDFTPETCPICLDDIKEKNTVVTKCGHTMHLECMLQHLKQQRQNYRNGNCPICRETIETFQQRPTAPATIIQPRPAPSSAVPATVTALNNAIDRIALSRARESFVRELLDDQEQHERRIATSTPRARPRPAPRTSRQIIADNNWRIGARVYHHSVWERNCGWATIDKFNPAKVRIIMYQDGAVRDIYYSDLELMQRHEPFNPHLQS